MSEPKTPIADVDVLRRELDEAAEDIDFWYQVCECLVHAMTDHLELPAVRGIVQAVEKHAAAGFPSLVRSGIDRYLHDLICLGMMQRMRDVNVLARRTRRGETATGDAGAEEHS